MCTFAANKLNSKHPKRQSSKAAGLGEIGGGQVHIFLFSKAKIQKFSTILHSNEQPRSWLIGISLPHAHTPHIYAYTSGSMFTLCFKFFNLSWPPSQPLKALYIALSFSQIFWFIFFANSSSRAAFPRVWVDFSCLVVNSKRLDVNFSLQEEFLNYRHVGGVSTFRWPSRQHDSAHLSPTCVSNHDIYSVGSSKRQANGLFVCDPNWHQRWTGRVSSRTIHSVRI